MNKSGAEDGDRQVEACAESQDMSRDDGCSVPSVHMQPVEATPDSADLEADSELQIPNDRGTGGNFIHRFFWGLQQTLETEINNLETVLWMLNSYAAATREIVQFDNLRIFHKGFLCKILTSPPPSLLYEEGHSHGYLGNHSLVRTHFGPPLGNVKTVYHARITCKPFNDGSANIRVFAWEIKLKMMGDPEQK
ncbi:hypothetical protein B0H16DRAFT_1453660 [Mycena metata]|uniref:Uncharacterized protein n=1 Tax=Mycena metata TaxID=1033252 RepID=A0AAD7JLX6_9AGAR|nr:hypothetical protein B0H16DRAFT_1453660 [Mycena metata]